MLLPSFIIVFGWLVGRYVTVRSPNNQSVKKENKKKILRSNTNANQPTHTGYRSRLSLCRKEHVFRLLIVPTTVRSWGKSQELFCPPVYTSSLVIAHSHSHSHSQKNDYYFTVTKNKKQKDKIVRPDVTWCLGKISPCHSE